MTKQQQPTKERANLLSARPTEQAFIKIVREMMTGQELAILWAEIKEREGPHVERFVNSKGTRAYGKALEYLTLRAFELDGADVTWPFEVKLSDGDDGYEQIDGAIHIDGAHVIVEAKDEGKREATADAPTTKTKTGHVNAEPIAKMRNQLLRRPSFTIGIFVSTNGFTSAAITLTRYMMPQTILLWDGDDLDHVFNAMTEDKSPPPMRDGLKAKLRQAVEAGNPYASLKELDDLKAELRRTVEVGNPAASVEKLEATGHGGGT